MICIHLINFIHSNFGDSVILKTTTFSVLSYQNMIPTPNPLATIESTQFICEDAYMTPKCHRSANRFHPSKQVSCSKTSPCPGSILETLARETSPCSDKQIHLASLPSALKMLKIPIVINCNPTRGNFRLLLQDP